MFLQAVRQTSGNNIPPTSQISYSNIDGTTHTQALRTKNLRKYHLSLSPKRAKDRGSYENKLPFSA